MSASTDARLRLVFALLTGVTLLSWWLGTRDGGEAFSPSVAITVSVLLIAALKVRVIVWEFMELRHAPAALRRFADAFLVLLMALLLGMHAWGLHATG
ncbi:MAG: cytochrome C oxidase subunit IV family protein [Sinimarinibacterium flocculans]|uniref:cytochrome C oxidase subunit IV family protein n=1 Tax=Sinimarinibacterium flocculans TaxID=985250 RepID=UPI003C559D13